MKEYFCRKCEKKLSVKYKDNRPIGECKNCGFKNIECDDNTNHVCYRDVIRHCPNCGINFETDYGPREAGGSGYDIKTHICPRCGWLIGWQHTFSHGEYVVAMSNPSLWDKRMYYFAQLRKYGLEEEDFDN